ncbi:Hpt domain-containing protein [Ihubacter sp. rT4E-8]|uniref:Hpt domain-containing protein n=1 Tax=unclassified Ihubacter TaxID=2633299 RepID=UPI00137A7312
MTIIECYQSFGGDYDDVISRLRSEKLVEKFAVKFLADKSYSQLEEALQADQPEEAFRAAHTLKGVCQNLGFTPLYAVSSEMSEILRNASDIDHARAEELMQQVRSEYDRTFQAIKAYAEQ